jgi:hypothetical protein
MERDDKTVRDARAALLELRSAPPTARTTRAP